MKAPLRFSRRIVILALLAILGWVMPIQAILNFILGGNENVHYNILVGVQIIK